MTILTKLFDAEDYALMIIQITICSMIDAGFLPMNKFLLAPVALLILRLVIAFTITLGTIATEIVEKKEEEGFRFKKENKRC